MSPDNFQTGITRGGNLSLQESTGKIVYVYNEKDASATTKDVYCIIFNSDMSVAVNAFRVNNNVSGEQVHQKVIVNQYDNSFVVTWAGRQSGNYDVYAKKISFEINNATSGTVSAATDLLVNNNTVNDQYDPKPAFDYERNELVIGYTSTIGAGNRDIFARRINYTTFAFINNEFALSTTTAGDQYLNAMEISPVTGELIAAFQCTNSGLDVHRRIMSYNPGTNAYTGANDERVNTAFFSSDQTPTSITINSATGDYVISWYSSGQDGSGYGIYSKIYSHSHAVLKSDFQIHYSTTDNQTVPKTVWDESLNQIIYFFNHSGSTSTVKYRIYDGNTVPGQFTPTTSSDLDAIGTQTTQFNYWGALNLAYRQTTHKVYLAYDLHNNYAATSRSRTRVSVLSLQAAQAVCPVNNPADADKHWVQVTSFDEFGRVIADTRTYSDNLGREIQTQTRNIEEDVVLAQATLYDEVGRPVLNTLPAPIVQTCFEYNAGFILEAAGSTPYNYTHYDQPVTTANTSGQINNPKPVKTSTPGTVGWYYSENNTYEPYVPTTLYPYSRVTPNDAIGGGVQRASKPGDALRMGQGHEVSSVTLPILWELNHYLSLRKYYVPGDAGVSIPSDFTFKGSKTVTRDENGVETVAFYDSDGKLLATALAGNVNGVNQNTINFTPYHFWSIYYEGGPLSITGVTNVEIYINGNESTPFYIGPISSIPSIPAYTFVLIRSNNAFSVNSVASSAQTNGVDLRGKNYLDFHIPQGTENTISISGVNFQIYNLETGAQVTYTPGNIAAGFYRIKNINPNNPCAFKNTLNYHDFTYYYYDDAERMVAMVSPNGVNLASTASPSFVTSYKYNTLNWTLSATSPDEGTTEYVYRKDGAIRFSRNALQLAQSKFSYTNYDKLGRPVEGGEYHRNASGGDTVLTFQNMADIYNQVPATSSIKDILELIDGIDNEKSINPVYTLYDVPDPALTTFISGYKPRNVNANVSKTWKKAVGSDAANISATWYSYDEQGLTEWMVQHINGLGTKTTDYEYDLMGNVKKVMYQKNTLAERFDHVYAYDAMQRLKIVQTRLHGGPLTEQAEYYYYLHGPLKRKEIAGSLQGIDYTYTIDGSLKAINHPDLDSDDPGGDSYAGIHSGFKKDVFGMSLEYYDNDYTRNTKFQTTTNLTSQGYAAFYNGNIRSATWNTQQISGATPPVQYAFSYDKKYQLLSAKFGDHNSGTRQFTAASNNKYSQLLQYDKNGNIIAQSRTNEAGVIVFF